jgi:hypothetical protein
VLVAFSVASYQQQPRPPVVYPDDAWPLIGAKVDGVLDLRRTGFTSTGFVLLERMWFALTSFSTANARVIPFAFYLAIGPTAMVVGRWLGLRFAAALVGAALLVTSPELASMATHAKQYTFEVVASLVLIGLAASVLRAPDRLRRWVAFVAGGAGALLMSFALVGIVVSGAAVGLLAMSRAGVGRRSARAVIALVATLAVFCVGLYLLLRPVIPFHALESFWERSYITSPERAGRLIARLFRLGFALPVVTALAVIVAAGLVVWRRPMLALLLGLPFGFAVVAAIAKAAPIGGGRTEVWLYPAVTAMVAVGVDVMLDEVARRGARSPVHSGQLVAGLSGIAVAIVVALLLVQAGRGFPGGADEYGGTIYPRFPNVEPLVDALEARRAPADLVVVSPAFAFSYPLYAPQRIRTHPTERNVAGWYPDLRGVDELMGTTCCSPDVAAFRTRTLGVDRVWTIDAPDARFPLGSWYAVELRRAGFAPVHVARAGLGRLTRWSRHGE